MRPGGLEARALALIGRCKFAGETVIDFAQKQFLPAAECAARGPDKERAVSVAAGYDNSCPGFFLLSFAVAVTGDLKGGPANLAVQASLHL